MQSENLKDTLIDIHREISRLSSLEPNSNVTMLFESLIRFCTQPPSRATRQLLLDRDIRALRASLVGYCCEAEGLLERHHAQRALATADITTALRQFPYYNEYQELVRMEYQLLCGVGDPAAAIHHVAFIGSGSMPMTAMILAEHFLETRFHAFDIDKEANGLARLIVARLGDQVSKRIRFTDADAEGISEPYAGFDLIYLAALVGKGRKEKQRIIAHLATYMRKGALLLVRSAHGLRKLLYPVVKEEDLAGFRVLVTARPGNDIVNSVIIARKM
ncbi:Nicotianamine synthase [Endogone sp. FLAS-F59071]|nr:Nicotianamine synthase [Endogone sp. FLAS-F59071]|eukprot:RUS22570.1 Nicotianamine synthase [Endogone sp. FLAS-F59071]